MTIGKNIYYKSLIQDYRYASLVNYSHLSKEAFADKVKAWDPKIEGLGKLTKVTYVAGLILIVIFMQIGLRAFGSPFYVVSSGSMIPTLKVGDVIVVEPTSFEDVKVGDIIVFKEPNFPDKVIVHRVLEIIQLDGERAFITKGDHNLYRDPWVVKKEYYVGKVAFSVPYAGGLSIFIKPPVNYVIIAALIAFIIIEELLLTEREGSKT